jgi:hypothetical protein
MQACVGAPPVDGAERDALYRPPSNRKPPLSSTQCPAWHETNEQAIVAYEEFVVRRVETLGAYSTLAIGASRLRQR